MYAHYGTVHSDEKTLLELTLELNEMNAGAAVHLRKYLVLASKAMNEYDYKFVLRDSFNKSLKDCNLKPKGPKEPNITGPRNDSQIATGSPKQNK